MSRKNRRKRDEAPVVRTPVAEQLLINVLPEIHERHMLCTTIGRGQFASAFLRSYPEARTQLHEFDVYAAEQVRTAVHDSLAPPGQVEGAASGFEVVCAADFPDAEFELAALPVDPRGEAELTSEMLQQAHCRLSIGGRLLAATSNPEDQWLHGELRKLFPKVTRRPSDDGVLYLATKNEPLKKLKGHECAFAFRDRGRLIQAVSRPGVFNHRGLDAGARALINTIDPAEGSRIVDLGCGSGVVALAAACRSPSNAVVAIDSHARAVDCTLRGAALNSLSNIEVRLDADGETGAPGTFDIAAGNPPYYSDFRIADIFLRAAHRALKPGGRVLIVTKALAWYEERMPQLFEKVHRIPHKAYTVLEGTRGR